MTDRRTHVSTVHHVAFRVDDMDAALEFYMGVLGCRMLPRPEGLPGARGAWLQCGATQVHLTEMPIDDTTGRPRTWFRLSARSVRRGADFRSGSIGQPDRTYSVLAVSKPAPPRRA